MIGLVLTLDYELYGDGSGSCEEHIFGPTKLFLKICDDYGVRSTIFVEVAEILRMKEYVYFERDMEKIEDQLIKAHETGHDIQLHIHPWWFNAEFDSGTWSMDYDLVSLCNLHADEALKYISECKTYLTELLKKSSRAYSCNAYRSGYLSMIPTENIFDALMSAEIGIDSSVFKWGFLNSKLMSFDYSNAFSNIEPWFFKREDVNKLEPNPIVSYRCLEMPIYSEYQRGFRFLSRKRLSLISDVRSVMLDDSYSFNKLLRVENMIKKFRLFLRKRAKKFDFCKCTFSEMKKILNNILLCDLPNKYLPVVAIGHSKDFIFSGDFRKLLSYIASKYSDRIEIVPITLAAEKFTSSQKMSK